jgi:hypothetical protein
MQPAEKLNLLTKLAFADADLADLESAVREGDARYAAIIADNELYPAIEGQTAVHHFLDSWYGLGSELQRENATRVSDASLGEIPEADFPRIAAKIEAMLRVPESARKKSASLSSSPSGSEASSL